MHGKEKKWNRAAGQDSISQSSCKCIMNIQSRKSDVSSIPFDTENTDGLFIFSDMIDV